MSATPCASSACTVAPSSRRSRTTPDLSNPVPSPTTTTDDQAPSPPLPARARDHVAAVVPRRIAGARAVMSNEIVTEAMLLDLEGIDRQWIMDKLIYVWLQTRARAQRAYENWRLNPGVEAYVAFRAAQDQADTAQDEL